MEQLSMFSASVPYPETYDDVERFFRDFIFEGEKDDDVFEDKDTKAGKSYFFYGVKVFTFAPGEKGKVKFVLDCPTYELKQKITPDNIGNITEQLKQLKHTIFRNLTVEPFACCHEFKKCSKVGACLHPDDRFYNRCYYRENLEAGKNFFKEDET